MATTQDLTRTAEYFINGAMLILRKISAGETLEPEEYASALETMQEMMRHWENPNSERHRRIAIDLPLRAGIGFYELTVDDAATGYTGQRVLDIHHVQYVESTGSTYVTEYPLTRIDGDTYRQFPNKTTEGSPSQYWFDRSPTSYVTGQPATDLTPDAANLYVWPAASTALQNNGGFLRLAVSVPYKVPQALTDVIDIPQEWHKAFRYNLAQDLYDEFGGNADTVPKSSVLWDEALEGARPAYIDFVPVEANYG